MGSHKAGFPSDNKTRSGQRRVQVPAKEPRSAKPPHHIRSLTPDPTKILYAYPGNLKSIPGVFLWELVLLRCGKNVGGGGY